MISNALGARVGLILSGIAGLSLFVGLIGLLVRTFDVALSPNRHTPFLTNIPFILPISPC